jgi:hypothetical protein
VDTRIGGSEAKTVRNMVRRTVGSIDTRGAPKYEAEAKAAGTGGGARKSV